MKTEVKRESIRLLSAKELAGILSISQRHLHRQNAAGKLPRPVKLGRSVRWRLSDIQLWQKYRCPSRREFEHRKKANGIT